MNHNFLNEYEYHYKYNLPFSDYPVMNKERLIKQL